MEKKEIKLGDLRVVRSDLGLDFYTNDYKGDEGPGHLWLNEKSTRVLFDWLQDCEKKSKKEIKIDYKDRSYPDKRRILRQLSLKDEIAYFLDIVADDVWDRIRLSSFDKTKMSKIIDVNGLEFYFHIRNFLIDGYLAFEIIFKDDKPVALSQLDPCNFYYEEKDGAKYYKEMLNGEVKRVLNASQVIYLSYSKASDMSYNSYVEELKESYERFKLAENALVFNNVNGVIRDGMAFEDLKWLNGTLHKTARITESTFETGSNADKRYPKFIDRLSKIFIDGMINKLIELNK